MRESRWMTSHSAVEESTSRFRGNNGDEARGMRVWRAFLRKRATLR